VVSPLRLDKRQRGFTVTARVDLHDDKHQMVRKGGMQQA
jgi:hypothetical protein